MKGTLRLADPFLIQEMHCIYRGNIGIMENKMENIGIIGILYRVYIGVTYSVFLVCHSTHVWPSLPVSCRLLEGTCILVALAASVANFLILPL